MNFLNYSYHYYLTESGEIIRILANFRPGAKSRNKPPYWVVYEFDCVAKKWTMASFPEITWDRLRAFQWIGKLRI